MLFFETQKEKKETEKEKKREKEKKEKEKMKYREREKRKKFRRIPSLPLLNVAGSRRPHAPDKKTYGRRPWSLFATYCHCEISIDAKFHL